MLTFWTRFANPNTCNKSFIEEFPLNLIMPLFSILSEHLIFKILFFLLLYYFQEHEYDCERSLLPPIKEALYSLGGEFFICIIQSGAVDLGSTSLATDFQKF